MCPTATKIIYQHPSLYKLQHMMYTEGKKITRSEHKPENVLKKSVIFLKSKKVRGSPLTFRFQIKQTSL